MQMPDRFDLTYIDKDGSKKRPIMLHRVIYGSLERFIGILIEHYAGAFPTWLSPVQVNIIPVNNEYHFEASKKINEMLLKNNIRAQIDSRDEKLSYRMRDSQIKKNPYSIIIGDKEVLDNLVSYRCYNSKETVTVSAQQFIKMVTKEINNKK